MSAVDEPPFSRLFVIGDPSVTDSEYKTAFEMFGEVQYVQRIKDRKTGASKGLLYVKMAKTSCAVAAVERLHGSLTAVGDGTRPLKVLIANSKNGQSLNDEEVMMQLSRLFIVVPKEYQETDVESLFSKYGDITRVQLLKEKGTNEPRGLAFVTFEKASAAAMAYESCGSEFKAKFAEPYSRKRQHDDKEDKPRDSDVKSDRSYSPPPRHKPPGSPGPREYLYNYPHGGHTCLKVRVPKGLRQIQLARLFNIVPTLEYCRHVTQMYHATDVVYVKYSAAGCCAYAKEVFTGLEYPPGFLLEAEFTEEERETSISSSKAGHYCDSTPKYSDYHMDTSASSSRHTDIAVLPQLNNNHDDYVKRLFVVSQPDRISVNQLIDLFRHYQDFVGFSYVTGKNYGFARFRSTVGADEAQKELHGKYIDNNKLKCLDAEDPAPESKRHRHSSK